MMLRLLVACLSSVTMAAIAWAMSRRARIAMGLSLVVRQRSRPMCRSVADHYELPSVGDMAPANFWDLMLSLHALDVVATVQYVATGANVAASLKAALRDAILERLPELMLIMPLADVLGSSKSPMITGLTANLLRENVRLERARDCKTQ